MFVAALLVLLRSSVHPLLNNNYPSLLLTCPLLFLLLSRSPFESELLLFFFHIWGEQNSTLYQLTFSILVKWSLFTKSPLHLSALIAHVCLPYNSLRTPLADIVADIERLTIMSPCFTLLLKLRCVMFYWHCSPRCASLFLSAVFECHSLSTRPHACSVYYITSNQVVFKCDSDLYLSRFLFPSRYLQWPVYSSTLWLGRNWSQYLGRGVAGQQINMADCCSSLRWTTKHLCWITNEPENSVFFNCNFLSLTFDINT